MRPIILLLVSLTLVFSRGAAEAPQTGAGELRITGGVGYRQFLRVSQWLARNLVRQEPAPRIWLGYHLTGSGFRDSVRLLAAGDAEICLVNARSVAAMAVRGRGLFEVAVPNMRAIAALPHHDWALFAVDASLGVRSLSDLRERNLPLKLATGYLDGDSAVGFMALEVLRRHGIDPKALEARGGGFLPGGPGENRADMASGKANAVFQEGARGAEWEELARTRPLAFLSIEADVAADLEEELGFRTLEVPASYYPGQTSPFVAADFSDWLICVRDDMDERLAYQLAQIIIERREDLEREYHADGPRYASINYPLEPEKLVQTNPVPLHAGAARYYREQGLQ